MASVFESLVTSFFTGDNLKDFQHASRLFVGNNYERSPKYTTLFHVYFDLNPELVNLNVINQRQQIESGMLVKSADLPKFRIDTKNLNNYNRPSIVQTKVRYEDINITFHDDSANIVRKLWFDYYNYYYRDMDNNYGDATGSLNPIYIRNTKQTLGQRTLLNKFGYSPRKDSNISTQYIQAIRIYSLHQKRFSEYTLINPTISAFRHGTHANGQDGTLENTMTVSYETVLYAGGSARVARGFADLHYDKLPSPLTVAGGGTNSILGPGGIVNALDSIIKDGGDRNWGSAAFKAVSAWQKNKNVDFVNLAKGELIQGFTNALRGGNVGSALNQTYIPYRGVNTSNGTGFESALQTQTTAGFGSVASNGFNITAGASAITGGIASALSGNPVASLTSSIPGVATNSLGQVTGGSLNNVLNVAKGAGNNLVATTSQSLPTNSIFSLIQTATDKIKSTASADNFKVLQENFGKSTAFLAQNLQTVPTTFTTGTNNIVQQASNALANTPNASLQIPAGVDTASKLSLENLTAAVSSALPGSVSTNPITI